MGDDDTTTINKIKEKVDPGIQKVSDKNHCRKNMQCNIQFIESAHLNLGFINLGRLNNR